MDEKSSDPDALAGDRLPGAARYASFLGEVFGSDESRDPHVREDRQPDDPEESSLPPEIELQSRWFAGDFGRHFRTTCGRTAEVIQFGFWNHGAGPDFTNASVEIDGELKTGAIELDPSVRHWEHHGHATNPVYDEVVLHLFFAQPAERVFTRTANHSDVPQVLLHTASLESAPERTYLPEARLGRCSTPLKGMSRERIISLLRSAAEYRLERKARRLLQISRIHGRQQALFQGIAEAFGYRNNKLPMTILAQRLPLRWLRKHREHSESTLFGLAGFLQGKEFEAFEHETRSYLRGLWESWWPRRAEFASSHKPLPEWKLSGVRPANHPQRRVAALARIVEHWKAFETLLDSGTFALPPLKKFLTGIRHEFWDYHYTLSADTGSKRMALIGSTRVAEILANQIFPLLIHENPELWNLYATQKSQLGNVKVRRAALRLFGDHPEASDYCRHLYQQQALLQIFDDFCLVDHSDCENCPFPEQLGQW